MLLCISMLLPVESESIECLSHETKTASAFDWHVCERVLARAIVTSPAACVRVWLQAELLEKARPLSHSAGVAAYVMTSFYFIFRLYASTRPDALLLLEALERICFVACISSKPGGREGVGVRCWATALASKSPNSTWHARTGAVPDGAVVAALRPPAPV
eukprot:5954863-Pleurochrysis_carterae.AAC.1